MKKVIFALSALCCLLWSESAQAQKAITYWKDGKPSTVFEVDSVHFWTVPAEAVDLGLPSGLKWASCNMGASKPEDSGSYFAWGETEEKDVYNWQTYVHCDGSDETVHDLGSVICATQYDVVSDKWSDKWRMPTKEEYQELIDNCTSEWTQLDGIDGLKFTGANGNSIFLPAAGDFWDDGIMDELQHGHYWSGSTDSGSSVNAFDLSFGSNSVNLNLDNRSRGFSIRPVLVEYALLVLSTEAVSMEVYTSETVEITDGNGEYSCSSEDPSMVTVNLEGTTLTLSALKVGETKVLVTDLTTQQTISIAVTVTPTFLPSDGIVTVNGVTFKMVRVPGDTFMMGGTNDQGFDTRSNEYPIHSVTLSDFAIGETEVTQALWQAVMGLGMTPSSDTNSQWTDFYGLGDEYPAYYISWDDCQAFIKKLNELTGMSFRLPTEAEWEYAARGGNGSGAYRYAGSNTLADVAWFGDNSYSLGSNHPDYGTHAVGTKAPNALGLYDMSGNVWEWCQDWFDDSYYASSTDTNPAGPESGSSRVIRGGSWYNYAGYCRVAYRNYFYPSGRYFNNGLRLAF